ncbi:MAG: GtrA family protein [Bacteroidales bacterium]|nr:GtrA family protein [Candidatus Scybalocola fimicaballi]
MLDKKEKLRETFFQLLRFAVVGVVATAIHYGVYLLLLNLLSENIAYTIGYLVSFVCNFILTCVFTFRKKASAQRGVGFGLAHLVNYGLHVALLNFFLWMGISNKLAPIPVFCIAVPVNFLLVRFVFSRSGQSESVTE